MDKLYLDLETRSTIDLRKRGLGVYAAHPTTDVILACAALGMGEVEEWRPGRPIPTAWVDHIRAGRPVVAHNYHFERAILHNVLAPRYGWPLAADDQWDCSMSRARAAGLPGSLDGALIGMHAPFGKDHEGHRLMLRMCRPRRIEKDGTIVWWDDEPRMTRLGGYCAHDVRGERWLDRRLPKLTEREREIWLFDGRLNQRGVRLDLDFCRDAARMAEAEAKALDAEMRQLTGGQVEKVSQVTRLLAWLKAQGVKLVGTEDDEDDGDEGEADED